MLRKLLAGQNRSLAQQSLGFRLSAGSYIRGAQRIENTGDSCAEVRFGRFENFESLPILLFRLGISSPLGVKDAERN